ncbi:MAG: 2'-deoxycytidine 5'-triphosphate deaminase [Chloroflexota bacterium]
MNAQSFSLFPELERDLQQFHTTGIVPYQGLKDLIDRGAIKASEPITEIQLQPASLDLRLGPVGYQVRASFLPTESSTVQSLVDRLKVAELDLTRPTVLERGAVYIIPLMEDLALPPDMIGKTNPKSTIGRLDAFTRLLTDYASEFERVPKGYRGKLYVEVAPRAFSVIVHQGSRLNQLRIMRGNPLPSDTALNALNAAETLVYLADDEPGQAVIARGLWISVNLLPTEDSEIVGYLAKQGAPPVDLDLVGAYDPAEFWEPVCRPERGELILAPGDFYILASVERIRVPPSYAAEMVGYDPSVGEFRLHYAGFFDPGFGYGDDDVKGTRAVLEVRSHEVPFLMRHGQRVGRLIYERLTAVPEKIYGLSIGSSYQRQELALSKQFRR